MTKPTEIILGSGFYYGVEWTGSDIDDIPDDTTIETDENCIGLLQGGASFSYKPTYYTAKDDMQIASKTVLTAEETHLKGAVVTANASTWAKLIATADVTTESSGASSGKVTIKIGGLANDNAKKYLIRFVHRDGKHRLTVVGVNQAEFAVKYTNDKETVIDTDFLAESLDGTGVKAIYEDTSAVAAAE